MSVFYIFKKSSGLKQHAEMFSDIFLCLILFKSGKAAMFLRFIVLPLLLYLEFLFKPRLTGPPLQRRESERICNLSVLRGCCFHTGRCPTSGKLIF